MGLRLVKKEMAFREVIDGNPSALIIDRTTEENHQEYLPVMIYSFCSTAGIQMPKIFIIGINETSLSEIESKFCHFVARSDCSKLLEMVIKKYER